MPDNPYQGDFLFRILEHYIEETIWCDLYDSEKLLICVA